MADEQPQTQLTQDDIDKLVAAEVQRRRDRTTAARAARDEAINDAAAAAGLTREQWLAERMSYLATLSAKKRRTARSAKLQALAVEAARRAQRGEADCS